MADITDWQRLFGPLLTPLAKGYARLMSKRAEAYARPGGGLAGALAGRFASYRPQVPCISVGNIAWGGTGKTPLTRWLGRWFIDLGLKPVVLTRGYGGRPARLPMAVHPHSLPEEAGDEALLLARSGIAVVVDPRRARSAAWVEARLAPDVLLMDDGFQHLALSRDLDLVILTPHDLTDGWARVLPAGAWREGPAALQRASAFLVHADPDTFDALERDIALALLPLEKPVFAFYLQAVGLRLTGGYSPLSLQYTPRPIATAGREPQGDVSGDVLPGAKAAPYFYSQKGHAPGLEPDLGGTPYALVSGVGTPERVAATAAEFLGYPPERDIRFGDHHAYTAADAARLAEIYGQGLEIVCTAKDAVKLAPLVEFPLWVLEVEPVFQESIDGQVWEEWLNGVWRALRQSRECSCA